MTRYRAGQPNWRRWIYTKRCGGPFFWAEGKRRYLRCEKASRLSLLFVPNNLKKDRILRLSRTSLMSLLMTQNWPEMLLS